MTSHAGATVLVTGATGFVGRALVPALLERGARVRAATRGLPPESPTHANLEWVTADLMKPETLAAALEGVGCVYYLVHSIGAKSPRDYRERDRMAATQLAQAASRAGVERIVYLGGVAPQGAPSKHLESRLEVGEVLRTATVPALELRASMIVGAGGASWRIVRDLALRLPAMILPRWLDTRSRPVALEDVVLALVDARSFPLERSAWFDLPGPEVLTGKEILQRIVRIAGRRLVSVSVPVLTPRLSAAWLKLITRTDFALARELVMGLTSDLLPQGERYWELTGHPPRVPFDLAAARSLSGAGEGAARGAWAVEESMVALLSRKYDGARRTAP
jgi:uncharacterized protein YbjT (DUF2867 family)